MSDDTTTPTVEASLAMLAEAVAKAADDFRAVSAILERARRDIASHNTSVSRNVVSGATRAVNHLRATDEALRDVLESLESRD